jgi:lysophospholipase L1-like esterase
MTSVPTIAAGPLMRFPDDRAYATQPKASASRDRISACCRPLLLLAALVAAALAAEPQALHPATECTPREGLPNVAAKLNAGAPVSIAYFGGSITAAPGWRVKSLAWFKHQFPQAAITEINAAIGGTGSDLGVYRLGYDVLRHKPDLVFVEFAVNDGGAEPLMIHRCMEGIVRQIWAANPATDICYVYTLTGGMLGDFKDGHFPRAASAMEVLADHYGIPSVHLGVEVSARERAGTLVFRTTKANDAERQALGTKLLFTEDNTHPTDAGHVLYNEILTRHLPELLAIGKRGPHAVPKALVADNYEQAKLLPLDQATLGEGWVKLDSATDPRAKSFGDRVPSLYRAEKPGTTLTFSFTGTAVSIYDLVGPDCGQLIVTVDGGAPRTVARIDGYCTYHRLASLRIASELPDALHAVTVRLDAAVPDKAKILFEQNRSDLVKNPGKYAGTSWYAGGIMLIGSLAHP